MQKNRSDKSDEMVELLGKMMKDPDAVSNTEKRRMKKLANDPSLLIAALQVLNEGNETSARSFLQRDATRTEEEIIVENYISLARFTIEQMNLKNVCKLQVQANDDAFTIYALTPAPVELDFSQVATSEFPVYKELLLEAEALQADLFLERGNKDFLYEIISRIESALL